MPDFMPGIRVFELTHTIQFDLNCDTRPSLTFRLPVPECSAKGAL